jgi:outer membrane protein TolC
MSASALAAAPTPTRTVRLEEALRVARERRPSLAEARARIAAARAEADVPRAQWKPRLGASAQALAATENNTTASYVGDREVAVPRIGSGKFVTTSPTMKPYASTFVGLGLAQELFDFGRIAAEAAAADALVEIEAGRADAERLAVDLAVREAFYAVRAGHAVVAAATSAVTRATAHRDLAAAGVASGLRPPIERTRAEADLARFELGRVRAEGALVAAEGALAAAMGADELEIDAAEGDTEPLDAPSLARALELAGTRDPVVRAALARLAAQRARTKAVGAADRPELALTAALTALAGGGPSSSGDAASFGGALPYVPNWDAGLVLRVPIYDGVTRARAEAARRREDVELAGVAAAKRDGAAAVERAFVTLETARAAMPALERVRDAAAANAAQAEARFSAGLGTGVELADAEALRTQAEIDVAVGRFEVARARAALGRAIGEGL